MTWSVIERRISATSTKPAAVSLHAAVRKGVAVSKPMCQVTIRFGLACQLDWKANEPVGLVIGTGEHAGLIRVVRGSPNRVGKCRVLARGGMSFNLGHVPQFGMESRPKTATDAKVIDPDTVEIVLPEWTNPADASAGRTASPAATREPVFPTVAANGVTVTFEPDNETVAFRSGVSEVTERQAKLASVLVRLMPEPCGKSDIIKKLWGAQPPTRAEAVVDEIARGLAETIREIGLTVVPFKGIGFALREVKSPATAVSARREPRNVSSLVFDDPPPGRSALDQKMRPA